ncbi:aminotransferase class I/II-fold pyridoxal phosphate-dependent enzyme [Paucilactobacillus nenjiangensis]|uniref:aminotransferase class I/II-fold pyridoxal phosphate-dependent enzyme n=1 Tax=Paucilactobacillus nenjiangensis TaxID=1296540 RepID=UPI003BB80F49
MDSSNLNQRYQHPAPNIMAEITTLAANAADAIDLSIGDPDFTTPQPIIDYAYQQATAGQTHYTEASGLPELRQTIKDYYHDRYQLDFDIDQIRATVGASHALYITLGAILTPGAGDEVIIAQPCFSPYADEVIATGGVPVILGTKPENGFAVQAAEVAALITPKTKAILLNSPNNPTGNVMSDEIAQQIADLAIEHDMFVLTDEVYGDFLMPGQHFTPFATFAPENTITFGSMSKSFAMTGWRIGYLIAPEYVSSATRLVNEGITYSAPILSQEAAIYAMKHADEFAPKFAAEFRERLEFIDAAVKEIDWLDVAPVEGGIYAFVDIRQTGLNSVDFSAALLKKTGIIVIPGLAFGQSGEGFIRIAATQPLDVIKEAFVRIKQLNVNDFKE